MAKTKKQSRLRRWLKRLTIALAVLLLAALLTPFLLTTTLVRFVLARSAYSHFHPQLSKASLSPFGALTLHDVELFEAGFVSDAPLLSAKEARIGFSWWDLWGSKLGNIQISGLVVHVRPGRTKPVTLLNLSYPPTMEGVAPELQPAAKGSASGSDPLWFDHLHATGKVQVHAFEDVRLTPAELPLTLDLSMHGARTTPHRDLILALGEPALARAAAASRPATASAPQRPAADFGPALTASLRMIPTADGHLQIAIDHGEAWNLTATLPPETLRRLIPSLPREWRDPMRLSLDRIAIGGMLDPVLPNGGYAFTGQLDLHEFSLNSPQAQMQSVAIDQLSFSAHIEAPLAPDIVQHLVVRDATTRFASLDYALAPLHAGRTLAEWTMDDRVIDIRTLQASALDGTLSGSLHLDLADPLRSQGKLLLEHIDQRQLMALTPASWRDRLALSAEGHMGGQVEIRQEAEGLMTAGVTIAPANDLAIHVQGYTLRTPDSWNPTPQQAHQVEIELSGRQMNGRWQFRSPHFALASLQIQAPAERLRQQWHALPADLKGIVALTIGSVEGDAAMVSATSQGAPRATAHLRLRDIDLQAPDSTDYPLRVQRLAANGVIDLPLTAPFLPTLDLSAAQITADLVQIAKLTAIRLNLRASLRQQNAVVEDAGFTLFGGQVTGRAEYQFAQQRLTEAAFQVNGIEQHDLLANVAPEKIDAEGKVSGTLRLWMPLNPETQEPGPLQISGNLASDAPGRLLIKDEDTAKELASQVPDAAGGLLPADFWQIAVAQLKSYPYLKGTLTLTTVNDRLELEYAYSRSAVKEGEPGYGVSLKVQGQPVLGAVTLQLSGRVHLDNPVDELLTQITGLQAAMLGRRPRRP